MKISIYKVEDWQALYIDGKKVFENHTITPEDILDAMNIEYTSTYIDNFDVDADYIPATEDEILEKYYRD